ncbi:helix-turn-helix transcriptional regulator [Adlercreutzia agrestimuris]|uniref:helix-turn-helix transcriptional regulator n=1 Tax=Adlercreutzia agrestimuris TaxID=2941324 RepID=UPI00203F9BC2|nr:helix-turn-helix transcriptional regulator [Adlercreutzia agrestimuris]
MSFRDNLLHLRSAHNMTQEQLAMLLGVSRQSVAKWESERSYPEMDKLLKMCDVFSCTLDDLVQGDLTDRPQTPDSTTSSSTWHKDLFGYDDLMRLFAARIANGVMAIILGVAIMVVFFSLGDSTEHAAYLSENLASCVALLTLFIGITIGLAFIIPISMSRSSFMKAHPYLENFYTQAEIDQTRKAFTLQLLGGIFCIFLGICILIALADTSLEELVGLPVLLALIAIGVRFIVHGGLMLGRTNLDLYNETAAEILEAHEISHASIPPEQKKQMLSQNRTNKKIGAICGCIMLISTVVALCILSIPYLEGGKVSYTSGPLALFWLPWPIGGILCAIVSILMKGFSHEDESL